METNDVGDSMIEMIITTWSTFSKGVGMQVTESIRYIGVDDTTLDLFEGQYKVLFGVSYNSYVILDDKVAIMDTVDQRAGGQWMGYMKDELKGRTPDYLIVQHLEPDHSANIGNLCELYPEMKIVCSTKAKAMLPQFFERDYSDRAMAVKEGDTLSLGQHTLHFIMAPMVHWPEVMVTYEESEKVLFSADAFGTFGANNIGLNWMVEGRRYYANIVGKFGPSVQALLKKASALDIAMIAPLHGPVLKENLETYINLYDKWSRYEPERKGILVAYASAHGNTKNAALYLARKLQARGEQVITIDLNRDDMSRAVEGAFCFDRIVLAASSYDGNLFPAMQDYLYHLQCKALKNRTFAIMENGSWAPIAGKKMIEEVNKMKDMTIIEPTLVIKTMRKDADEPAYDALVDALVEAGK